LSGLIALTSVVALSRTIIIAIRRRLTYPHTGYVSFRRQRRGKEAAVIALILIALPAIFVLMALTTNWLGGLTAISGITIGVIDLYLGRMTDCRGSISWLH
jgi:cobalamin synthase